MFAYESEFLKSVYTLAIKYKKTTNFEASKTCPTLQIMKGKKIFKRRV